MSTVPLPLPSDRSFGTLFTVVFALAAGVGWWHGKSWAPWTTGLGLATLLATLVVPAWLRPFNRAWMTLGEWMNRIVSPIVLGLIYFVLFTPLAYAMRLVGRDALRLRRDRQAASYWIDREPPGPDPKSLPNQF